MSSEEIRLCFADWYKFYLKHHGQYCEERLHLVEQDANTLLQKHNYPLSYALMNAAVDNLNED